MDMVKSSAVLFSIALVFIAAIITKVAWRRRITADPATQNTLPHPPAVITGVTSAVRLLHTLHTKGFRAMLDEQYTKFGSVFTISFFGMKTTFLVGPEVSAHFYQGLDSEVSHNMLEFTVPMLGKHVAYGVDVATRTEQTRFYVDALKPSKMRCLVAPMLQEVEVSDITCLFSFLTCDV
jgi:sterol 14-demethylase